MISKWGVRNFKSILEADLDLAPLTVFTGVNSSGKSSFLQSMVMLAQAARENNGEKIALRGDLIDLGSTDRIYHKKNYGIGVFCDVLSEKNEDLSLVLGLSGYGNSLEVCNGRLGYKKNGQEFSVEWTEDFDAFDKYDELWQDKMSLERDWASGRVINNKTEIPARNVIYRNYAFLPDKTEYKPCNTHPSLADNLIRAFIDFLSYIPEDALHSEEEAKKYEENMFYHSDYEPAVFPYDVRHLFCYCANNLFWLPYNGKEDERPVLLEKIPYFKEKFDIYLDKHKHKNDGLEGAFYNMELFHWYLVLSNQDKEIQEIIKKELKNESGLIQSLRDNFNDFYTSENVSNLEHGDYPRDCFYDYFRNKIKYLGPLRMDPKDGCADKEEDIKQTENETPGDYKKRKAEYERKMTDVGVKGENTMSVINYLHNNQYTINNYLPPDFFENQVYNTEKEKEFSSALVEWLKYFGIAGRFKKTKEDKQITVNFYIDDQPFTLTQLGTGVSQIVPILVRCLAAEENTTLIIQEPEQSLHPKLQSKLADLFIAMALSGRQCLIETHSEYIIEQIRCRIITLSELKPEPLHKLVKLYFVTKNDGCSDFKDIAIDENASLDEWPEDFFDESHKLVRKMMEAADKKEERDRKKRDRKNG